MEINPEGKYVEINDQKIELKGATLLHLNEIRKWTQFLSILGFVAVGLLVFVGILLLVTHTLKSMMQFDSYSMVAPWIGIFYIVLALIYYLPVFYMYRFSVKAKNSLMQVGSEASNELMASAFHYLKKHFRFVGVFTLAILGIYLLVIIGLVIALALR